MNKKIIKITNRGYFTTSRGKVRGPIGPYSESIRYIMIMITREKANIVEILEDGTECPLTIQNFDKDNNAKISEKKEFVEATVVESKKPVVEEKKEEAPVQTARQLSKKEKRKLEQEQKLAEIKAAKEEAKKVEESVVEEKKEEVPTDTVVPETAIES